MPHLARAEGLGHVMSQGLCAKEDGPRQVFYAGSPSCRGSQALEAIRGLKYNRPADLGVTVLLATCWLCFLGQVTQPR